MLNNLLVFWNGFTFDLLIGIISCVLGVIALFVCGTVYKNCKINNTNNKYQKSISNNSDDHSNNSNGDLTIIYGDNYNSDIKALVDLNSKNFSDAIEKVYLSFTRQCESNLHQMIQEADRIIKEKKLELGSYSKIDWINVYFESAKNTSDTYMQNVWAKVLVKELSQPNSFSYKTLDVLKNLSSTEFQRFERISKYVISDSFVFNDIELNDKFGIQYFDIMTLDENGLINSSGIIKQTITTNSNNYVIAKDSKHILLSNKINSQININVFELSNSGKEILNILEYERDESYFVEFAKKIKSENLNAGVSLHTINFANIDGSINYNPKDILA